MIPRSVQCFAHGRNGVWEGVCIDLDIAVQGVSFDAVKAGLDRAVATYIEDARREDAPTARRLLSRRAPLSVRLRLAAGYLAHIVLARGGDRDFRAGFDLPCPV